MPWLVRAEQLLGLGRHRPDVLDRRGDRRERDEHLGGRLRQEPSQRGLARPGWPPQDDRAESIGLHQGPERCTGAEQVVLADHLVEVVGTQTVRQRSRAANRSAAAAKRSGPDWGTTTELRCAPPAAVRRTPLPLTGPSRTARSTSIDRRGTYRRG